MTFPKKAIYDTFGGDLRDKKPSKNFHQVGATDIPAEDFNQCRASLAAATHISFQAYMKYDTFLETIVQYETAWDKIKTGPPTISTPTIGQWNLVFPASYINLRGKRESTNIFGLQCNADTPQDFHVPLNLNVTGQRTSPNTFSFFTFKEGQVTDDLRYVDLYFF